MPATVHFLYATCTLCYNPNRTHKGAALTGSQTHPASSLDAHYDDQDRRFAAAFRLLEDAIAARAFPAASAAVTHEGKLCVWRAMGRFTYETDSPQPEPNTIFDLASLTKVIATTSMAMVLYERGLLDLDMPVISIVGEFAGEDPRRDEVTLRMLLAHCLGPAGL